MGASTSLLYGVVELELTLSRASAANSKRLLGAGACRGRRALRRGLPQREGRGARALVSHGDWNFAELNKNLG